MHERGRGLHHRLLVDEHGERLEEGEEPISLLRKIVRGDIVASALIGCRRSSHSSAELKPEFPPVIVVKLKLLSAFAS